MIDELIARSAAAEVAERAFGDDMTEENYTAVVAALSHLRHGLRAAYGVECPHCGGLADVPAVELPAGPGGPAELTMEKCPTCQGDGSVLPVERDDWLARNPDATGET